MTTKGKKIKTGKTVTTRATNKAVAADKKFNTLYPAYSRASNSGNTRTQKGLNALLDKGVAPYKEYKKAKKVGMNTDEYYRKTKNQGKRIKSSKK